jgi:hypothetical protein
MAQRNLDFSPDVTNVVPENVDSTLSAISSIGAKIADDSAKSKMLVANAQVQTEFKKLDANFRLQYADDPTNSEGLKALSEQRQQLVDTYGDGIPLLWKRQWNTEASDLALKSSLGNDLWGFEQQRTNVVKNFNDAKDTYLTSAQTDGMTFGKDSKAVLGSTLDYLTSRGKLEEMASPMLGEQKTREMLQDYDSDYVKVFASGVVETNPEKALELLNNPEIRATFRKPEEWEKFKVSTEQRAKAVYKNNIDGGVLASIKRSNELLRSGGGLNYTQLQQEDLTDEARIYFEGLSGFKGTGKRGGFTAEDKAGFELAIFDAVQNLQTDKNMDPASVRVVQDAIYKGMNAGAITQQQGQQYISQIVEPLIAKKEEAMKQYGEYKWFDDDIGFDGIQEFYDNSVFKSADGLSKDTARAVNAGNKVNKANLYDYYFGALTARADAAGVPVADLPRLPRPQRNKIYSEAQTAAQTMFMRDRHPALRTLPDVPNFVYSNGQLIQGAAGPRDVKAVKTAQPTFKLQKDTVSGDIYRVYKNGQQELVRKGGGQ